MEKKKHADDEGSQTAGCNSSVNYWTHLSIARFLVWSKRILRDGRAPNNRKKRSRKSLNHRKSHVSRHSFTTWTIIGFHIHATIIGEHINKWRKIKITLAQKSFKCKSAEPILHMCECGERKYICPYLSLGRKHITGVYVIFITHKLHWPHQKIMPLWP